MEKVYIIDAARSAVGKFLGALSGFTAPRIGAEVVKGLMLRTGLDKALISQLNAGIVLSAGVGQNPAKQVVRAAGLPDTVSTCNVNMVCASGMRAIAISADSIANGNADVVIAGGMESMSNAPYTVKGLRGINKLNDISLGELLKKAGVMGKNLDDTMLVDEMVNSGLWDCYNDMHMGALAEKIGKKYKIPRNEQDEFALASHTKAAKAADSGKFKDEIIPIMVNGKEFSGDEGIRRDTSMAKLSALKPAFGNDGTVTAGNASQLSDGASFLMLASESRVKELGIKPLGLIEAYAYAGNDPAWYGLAPTTAVKTALSASKHKLDEMDLIEINEAFCVQTLGVVKELGINVKKLNVNGGAIALGHPIGASGARILTTLLYALKDRKKKLGLAALCHGGGGAMATIVRRL